MDRLIKSAVIGTACIVLAFLLAGGLPLLRKHAADLVVFVCFVTGILIISYALFRKGAGRK